MAFISSELAAVLAGVKDFTPAAALAVEAALRNLDGIRLLIMSLRRVATLSDHYHRTPRAIIAIPYTG
jgi:hypothetical protein